MNHEYYILVGDQQKGPYALNEMQSMWRGGIINRSTRYWRKGLPEWTSCLSLAPLLDPSVQRSSVTPNPKGKSDSIPIFSSFSKVVIFGVGGLILLIVCVAMVHNVSDHGSPLAQSTPVEAQPSLTEFNLDPISRANIAQVMKDYGASDVAVRLVNDEVKLVLIVPFGTSRSKAQEMGENFVRLVKSMSGDEPPGKEIGRGKFNYDVAVATPDEKFLVRGMKSDSSTSVWW